MLKAAVELLRPALRILLEATPEDIDLDEVRRHLLELPEVQSVHDLHAWTLTSSLPILTAHVVVTDECLSTGEAGPRARPPAGVPGRALRRGALDAAVRVDRAHRARARRARLTQSRGRLASGRAASNAATSSTCSVMGKMSKARSAARSQPASRRTRTSRPNEAGSHET